MMTATLYFAVAATLYFAVYRLVRALDALES
jgi:hypothetical protein